MTTVAPAPALLRVRPTRLRASPLGGGLAAAALALVLVSAASAQATPPAAQAPPPGPAEPERDAAAAEKKARIERAMALFDEARARYQRGEYRAAIVKLEEAAALDPEGRELVYNLAIIHEKLGELARAEVYFRRYLEMETDPEAREEVEATLRRLEGAKKELAPAPPGAPPRSPPRTEPPPPRPAAEAPAPRPVRPSVLVAGGVAAGAFLVGNIFALSAILTDPGSDARTGPGLSADEIVSDARAAHRYAVVADVALIVAGAAGGLALYLHLSPPPSSRRTHPVTAPPPMLPAPPRPFSRETPTYRPRGAPPPGPAATFSISVVGSGARLGVQF